ncbi:MAG: UbiD family decarboxylase [Pirellulaceae bacterium]
MTSTYFDKLVNDLRHGKLLVIDEPVDPHLELVEIQRRVYHNQGPALLFQQVIGCKFPVATNLFGTLERARLYSETHLIQSKQRCGGRQSRRGTARAPGNCGGALAIRWRMRPNTRIVSCRHAVHLPSSAILHIPCWPDDGGAFVTLPQVLSQMPSATGQAAPSLAGINLGMYRVQLSGNSYDADECGLHYQIHRGIGVHHAAAIRDGQPLRVNVTVGGTPAMTVAAVMPLPEGMSELTFAGALAGHRIRLAQISNAAPIYADADFCIVGQVDPQALKPEGPFGDHLGYYAKVHDFPVLKIARIYHRRDAVWPMTVVGRPPQEDTTFGELIHELTAPVIPTVLPGVQQVHAVDAAGVHPLLMAVGSERYTPYRRPKQPQELLTQAVAILGQGQLSLAKYLWIIDGSDAVAPRADNIADFFEYVLRRVDWRRDLHFITQTTMDTLDYSGHGWNQGSKLIVATGQVPQRELSGQLPARLRLPDGWTAPQVALPGVLVVNAPPHSGESSTIALQRQCDAEASRSELNGFPLVVVVDDSHFTARTLENFLWTTFTRSNPAVDVYGFGASLEHKHFGCTGSLVIDARSKPHHAPGLMEAPETMAKVDARATRGDALAKWL